MFVRGRSLLWLSGILVAGAALSWGAREAERGPASFQQAWPTLAGSAAFALLVWLLFRAAYAVAKRSHPDGARSLVHLQTLASAIVAILVVGAIVGGFQTALVSLGLVGFGLTLALQRPILSIAGWASLVFGGSVRVGDRIRVGDLTGDVLDITLFTTRLWEVGQPGSPTPGRPTGQVVTVSNAVFLEKAVANATSDTPIVFDEFVVNVAFESDQALARQLLEQVGRQVVDSAEHEKMARNYRRLTRGLSIERNFPDRPFILAESKPSWMEYRLRYLVDARTSGRVQSRLTDAWNEATAQHPDRVLPIYNRTQSQQIDASGRPLHRT